MDTGLRSGRAGVSTEPGLLVVDLALILPGEDTNLVREFLNHDDHYGDHALETEFRFTGIDSGTAVALRLDGMAAVGPWPALCSARVGRLEGAPGREEYVQDADGVGQGVGLLTAAGRRVPGASRPPLR